MGKAHEVVGTKVVTEDNIYRRKALLIRRSRWYGIHLGRQAAAAWHFFEASEGRGGLMEWVGISWMAKTSLVFVRGTMDVVAYIDMLKLTVVPIM